MNVNDLAAAYAYGSSEDPATVEPTRRILRSHRVVSAPSNRAWCYSCEEWCTVDSPCGCCE